jgi:pyrroline-5-carboxylate reductase
MSRVWGFIGCGNLAQAIIRGALKTGALSSLQVLATNRTVGKLKKFKDETHINTCESNEELLQKSDVIVLATKPQDIGVVLDEISSLITDQHLIVSLAAGVPADMLERRLNKARAVFRVMANTPAMIQKGLFGVYMIKGDSGDSQEISNPFEKIGVVIPLKNDKEINAMTAGAASGTGFVLQFMEDFEKWFMKKGFSRVQAREAAVETFLGTASLAHQRQDQSLQELREGVTSKKGTTLAGLMSMKKAKVSAGIQKGLDAAYERSLGIAKDLRPKRK